MPTSFRKKPLGAWPDKEKHQASEDIEISDEQKESGTDPDPEHITGADEDEPRDTLDMAKDAGLYADQDEEHPGEIGVAEQEEEDLIEEEQS